MKSDLYLYDSYLKEFDAKVTLVKDGKFVVLDQTAFYPVGGGQTHDTGTLITSDGRSVKVVFVGKFDGVVSHQVEPENVLKEGDVVHGVIDWDRRYKLMRMHTAAHLVSAIMYNESQVVITGNELQPEQSRMDFSFDKMDAAMMQDFIRKSNESIKKNIVVKTYFLPKGEAMKIPGIVKLAGRLPPDVSELRIVEIEGIDVEADGGTHVRNLSEIGEIVFLKTENKGKGRKRVYYTLKP